MLELWTKVCCDVEKEAGTHICVLGACKSF